MGVPWVCAYTYRVDHTQEPSAGECFGWNVNCLWFRILRGRKGWIGEGCDSAGRSGVSSICGCGWVFEMLDAPDWLAEQVKVR